MPGMLHFHYYKLKKIIDSKNERTETMEKNIEKVGRKK
jgi:hypothetical protein